MNGTSTGVHVEVILLRLDAGRLHYRCTRGPLADGQRPDDLALRLAQISDVGGDRTVCHSTSWRHQDGVVTLTYAAVPDPAPDLAATALIEPAVICSGDPVRPTPPDLHAHHIAAHAVRHLAYLADTDPAITAAADALRNYDLWQAIRAIGPDTPAATHESAHRMAGHRAAS